MYVGNVIKLGETWVCRVRLPRRTSEVNGICSQAAAKCGLTIYMASVP